MDRPAVPVIKRLQNFHVEITLFLDLQENLNTAKFLLSEAMAMFIELLFFLNL